MAEGTNTYMGLAVPIYGESEIQQTTLGNDILSITGVASQTGDFLVLQNSSGTERFVIEDGGNVVIVKGAAADVGLSIKGYGADSADFIKVMNSDASKIFNVNSVGVIKTMCLTTQAIASIASNASTSFSLAGITTDSAVLLLALKTPATANGIAQAFAQGTTRVDVFAEGGSVAANTYAVWAFQTTAN